MKNCGLRIANLPYAGISERGLCLDLQSRRAIRNSQFEILILKFAIRSPQSAIDLCLTAWEQSVDT